MHIKQRLLPEVMPDLGSLPALLQRLYAARGVTASEELDINLQSLLPFHGLTDIDKACLRLERALRNQEKILVIGDFDADGATSTALAIRVLRLFGAEHIDYLVPNRFAFGYGLTPGIVGIAKTLAPHLIITVDNGIASFEGVQAANEAGIDVLITDHHLPAGALPPAVAIVNPNQDNDRFSSKSIAGVGVIFYVMLALRRHLSTVGWFAQLNRPEPSMAQCLDLVALGTVADVVALDHNNRILVSQGLARIRQGHCCPGIKALIQISGRNPAQLRASDLGFSIAPRLNAAGRLDDMSLGIECLLSESEPQALLLAQELDALNQERRVIETQMKEQAFKTIQHLVTQLENAHHLPRALCLTDPDWHQGVIGILAGRLKERYHRPVVLFAAVGDGELKGSARSVASLNIRDCLAAVDSEYPGLITKFGGHAMAAGLSIHPSAFSDFQAAFVREVEKHLDLSQCQGVLFTDGALNADELTLDTARLLQQAGPWGQQFPEPCFDNVLDIVDQRVVGQHHLKITFRVPQTDRIIDGIAFNIDKEQWPNHRASRAQVVYRLDVNVYQGKSTLQLMVDSMTAM